MSDLSPELGKTEGSKDPLFTAEGLLPTFDEAKLLEHFKVSDEIRSVFYEEENSFAPERPQNKLRNKRFINVWFKSVTIRGVTFQDCVFEDCRLIGTIFLECEFHDCTFRRCNTHKIQFQRTYIDPTSFIEMPDRKKYSNIGVHLFQQLYRNSAEMLQSDFSNSAEYEFKKWQRYELSSKWRNNEPHKGRIARRWASNLFFSLVSGYGLKPLRVVGWLLLTLVCVVVFNYSCWTSFKFHSGSNLNVDNPSLPLAVYYSIVTLTTLGYGDITPQSDFGLIATSTEVIFGLVGLAMLASALIKKVLR